MLTGGRTWSSIHLPEEGNTSIAFRLTGAKKVNFCTLAVGEVVSLIFHIRYVYS